MLFQYIKKKTKPFLQNILNDFALKKINPKFNAINSKISELSLQIHNLHQDANQAQEYLKRFLMFSTEITKLPSSVGVLRDIQLTSLMLLKNFDSICRKHNLRYWLDYGTLLGAVRHRGFIPWDDDLDVSMPIEDYKKFELIANDEFSGTDRVLLRTPSEINKIVHKDFMPETQEEHIKFIFWQTKGKLSFSLDIFPYYPSSDFEYTVMSLKETCRKKNDVFNALQSFNDFYEAEIHVKDLAIRFLSLEDSTKFLFQGAESLVYQPLVRKIDDIYPLKEIQFESLNCFCPNHPENILTDLYGDYMQFPGNIYPHHLFLNELNREELKKIKKVAYESL